jgi:GAF domain-containing protein
MKTSQKDPGAYVRRVQEGAQSLAHDLIAEIERLQVLVAALEAEKARHEAEQARLQAQLESIKTESQSFSARYAQVELQNSNLANLYVASYRLHGTLDRAEVIAAIQEIIANLVGSEEAGLFALDRATQTLRLEASFGLDPETARGLTLDSGPIGRAARTGEIYVAEGGRAAESGALLDRLTACIPLTLEGKVTGVIALFRLLPQKAAIEDLDRELFELLATQAAAALYCTSLHAKQAVDPAGR